MFLSTRHSRVLSLDQSEVRLDMHDQVNIALRAVKEDGSTSTSDPEVLYANFSVAEAQWLHARLGDVLREHDLAQRMNDLDDRQRLLVEHVVLHHHFKPERLAHTNLDRLVDWHQADHIALTDHAVEDLRPVLKSDLEVLLQHLAEQVPLTRGPVPSETASKDVVATVQAIGEIDRSIDTMRLVHCILHHELYPGDVPPVGLGLWHIEQHADPKVSHGLTEINPWRV